MATAPPFTLTRLMSAPVERCRAIADLRGIARGDEAIGLKGRLEASQLLQAGIGANTLVLFEHAGGAILVLYFNGHDLALETSLGCGAGRAAMALKAECIEFFPAQFPLPSH